MLIQAKDGSFRIEPNLKEKHVLLTASDFGGLDGSSPDLICIKVTGEQARHLASALLQAEKELDETSHCKTVSAGGEQ